MTVFAERGLHGASTEEIARLAGISQPYVFRLFGTKKELYLAVVARCFRKTLGLMQQAAEGKRGREALDAIGLAYGELLKTDRIYLRAQMQAYAACDDPEICGIVRRATATSSPTSSVSRRETPERVAELLRQGDAHERDRLDASRPSDRAVGVRLLEGCKEPV